MATDKELKHAQDVTEAARQDLILQLGKEDGEIAFAWVMALLILLTIRNFPTGQKHFPTVLRTTANMLELTPKENND